MLNYWLLQLQLLYPGSLWDCLCVLILILLQLTVTHCTLGRRQIRQHVVHNNHRMSCNTHKEMFVVIHPKIKLDVEKCSLLLALAQC